MEVALNVNGSRERVDVAPAETLLHTLREGLGLTGTKEACVEGECGACTVLVDGRPLDSCIYATAAADGCAVTTVEGLADADGTPSPLSQAFVDHFAIQCGFCTPGMLAAAKELLDQNPNPSDEEIREAISGNLCRCTGYEYIINAIRSAAAKLRAGETEAA